ncbi:MAG: threonylcarbamoyl-AMP synthase [Spirochaetaceae bacterium]|jgi:L-threonylcarbamoyladenylate synthase|nr:threonylcarbamoyl-AMP synthase [Spirochaetaceae bacterium]
MPVFPADSVHIRYAANVLREGGIAAFPTETVYGLGADVFNTDALARVFAVKRRPRFDPLIVHIAHRDTLDALVDFSVLTPPAQRRVALLAETFWPGPLTLVLPKLPRVPGLATAGLATVAIRFPDHPVALQLIGAMGENGAVAAPSANPFGYLSPTRAAHVAAQLGDQVPVILDGGPCRIGVESTVLDIGYGESGKADTPRILRPGGVTLEALREVIPTVEIVEIAAAGNVPSHDAQSSPGLLKSHYAPTTPLYLHSREEMRSLPKIPGHAYLYMEETVQKSAARLFDKLNALDHEGYTAIHAELAPEEGLGLAINDRLRRAAAKTGAGQDHR